MVSTSTVTSTVPASSSIESPSTMSVSLIDRSARLVSFESGTSSITTWSWLSKPLAAVTVTINSFSPAVSSMSPTISKVAAGSVVSTMTSTDVAPGSISKVSPSATSEPSTWKVASEVSVFSRTTIVKLYS